MWWLNDLIPWKSQLDIIKESISLEETAMHSACAHRWHIRRECICFYLVAAWIRPTVDAAFHNKRGASVCKFAEAFFLQMCAQFSVLHFSEEFLCRILKSAICDVLDLLGLSAIWDAFARCAILWLI